MKTAKVVILILEGINVIVGITANAASLNDLQLLGLPAEWWNIICFAAFFAGFLVLYFLYQSSGNAIKKDVYEQVRKDIDENLKDIKPQEGSLDNVTQQDRLLIMSLATQMILHHGHQDFNGLFADRASGVPLNELITRNCQVCGVPRNRWSRK